MISDDCFLSGRGDGNGNDAAGARAHCGTLVP